jgi:hypothetical protein
VKKIDRTRLRKKHYLGVVPGDIVVIVEEEFGTKVNYKFLFVVAIIIKPQKNFVDEDFRREEKLSRIFEGFWMRSDQTQSIDSCGYGSYSRWPLDGLDKYIDVVIQ